MKIQITRHYEINIEDSIAAPLLAEMEANGDDPTDVEAVLDALDPDYDYWLTDEKARFA